tara:strand:- start:105 stop:959 length:855 start_codon:yes stop_codon:yes gene_type:complete
LIKVDIDEPISDLQYSMKRDATDSISMMTRKHRYHRKPYIEVRVILDRFTDDALARELYSMESHLQKGGYCGFSADRDKSWLSWIGDASDHTGTEVLAPGTASFNVNSKPVIGSDKFANKFAHWESGASVTSGDVLHFDGILHRFNHEELEVASSTLSNSSPFGKLTMAASHSGFNRYSYEQGAIVRFRDFWPALCLPENQVGRPIITHDHRINYTFDAVFHYYPGWTGYEQKIWDPPTISGIRQSDRSDTLDDQGGTTYTLGGVKAEERLGTGSSLIDSIIKY